MAHSLSRSMNTAFQSSSLAENKRTSVSVGFNTSLPSSSYSSSPVTFHGIKVDATGEDMGSRQVMHAVPRQTSHVIGKAMRWWEKGVQPNMKEINSAQDLVDSLANAGNKLVIVDFFSPGCGGCKALHPKICQFAESNPEVEFMQVNYEEHRSMCYSLNVHVLPFFRFYRGAQGRVCSFSCTNATVKKFRDALAKHGSDRCSLGPARGLEEEELQALEANRDLSFTYTRTPLPEPVPYHELEGFPPYNHSPHLEIKLSASR